MKRKLFCLFLAALFFLTCCSCRSGGEPGEASSMAEATVSTAGRSKLSKATRKTATTTKGASVTEKTTAPAGTTGDDDRGAGTDVKAKEKRTMDLSEYSKIWAAEFDDPDELKTLFVTNADHMNPGKGSNLSVSEDQNHIYVENSELVLRLTDNGDGTYVAPRSVSTTDKMSFRYGYLEMRAMVPYQEAAWPSLWLKADKNLHRSDSRSEIDIFEVFGSQDTCVPNLHKHLWDQSGTIQISNKGNYQGRRGFTFPDKKGLSTQYHTYGFEWTSKYMAFYVDGEWYYKVSIKEADDYCPDKQPGMDCFRDYHYICLNNWLMNMRGEYTPEQGGYFPAEYRIDYIRLYQKDDGASVIKIY